MCRRLHHTPAPPRRGRASARLGLPVALAMLAACGCGDSGFSGDPSPQHPSILFVVLDGTRADRLGCYGYPRETTPAIDALARDPDAVVYRRHYVQGAHTKPSTASLFVGHYVFEHGAILGHEHQERPVRPRFLPTQVLSGRWTTMAERLRSLGFYTFGVVEGFQLDNRYGFDQGFDDYIPPAHAYGEWQRVAKTVELIRAAPGRFFGYLHLAGCDDPYELIQRHPRIMERYGFDYDEQARMRAGVDFTTSKVAQEINNGRLHLDPEDTRFLSLVYDAKLASVDANLVSPLIEALKDAGRYDNTLIILTADHGEELYEHGGYGDGHALWDEIVHVPLIVKFPRGHKPRRLPGEVNRITQSIDLLPSLLAWCGMSDSHLPGRDIFQGAPGDRAYSETADAWAIIEGDHKLIVRGRRTLLFDRRADPHERTSLAASDPQRVQAMRDAAYDVRHRASGEPPKAVVLETAQDR